ncbi:MAG: MFS transporter [Thermodesulfobacteriota bacterium]
MLAHKGLWSRNFFLLWQGQTVSLAGSSLSAVAFSLWIVDATGSAATLGAILMVGSLTGLVLSPAAGAIADRYSRVGILVACDVALGVFALALAGVVAGYARHPGMALAALFLLQAGNSAANAFFATSARAITPDLVPFSQVPAANAVTMASLQMAGLLGKGLGGLAYRILGAPLLFALDGLTFFVSAGTEALMRVPRTPAGPPRGWRARLAETAADTRTGFAYVWRHRGLRTATLVNASAAFFLDPLIVLLPFLVKDERFLGASGDWYGYLLSAFGVGILGGYTLAAVLPSRLRRRGAWITGALAAGGLGFAALGLTGRPGVALALMAGNGIFLGLFGNHVVSLVQTQVSPALRARTLAVFQTLALCLSPLAVGLAGVSADLLRGRVDVVFTTCGACACCVALGSLLWKDYRDFLAGELAVEKPGPCPFTVCPGPPE